VPGEAAVVRAVQVLERRPGHKVGPLKPGVLLGAGEMGVFDDVAAVGGERAVGCGVRGVGAVAVGEDQAVLVFGYGPAGGALTSATEAVPAATALFVCGLPTRTSVNGNRFGSVQNTGDHCSVARLINSDPSSCSGTSDLCESNTLASGLKPSGTTIRFRQAERPALRLVPSWLAAPEPCDATR